MQMPPSLDGDIFEVPEVRGDVVEALLGFADAPDCPQKLLIRLRRSGWHAFFLSSYVGHWDTLNDEERDHVLHDYAGIPLVDYGVLFGLREAEVRRVSCGRRQPVGTKIVLELDRGILVVGEVDPSDHHSDSYVRWLPGAQQ